MADSSCDDPYEQVMINLPLSSGEFNVTTSDDSVVGKEINSWVHENVPSCAESVVSRGTSCEAKRRIILHAALQQIDELIPESGRPGASAMSSTTHETKARCETVPPKIRGIGAQFTSDEPQVVHSVRCENVLHTDMESEQPERNSVQRAGKSR